MARERMLVLALLVIGCGGGDEPPGQVIAADPAPTAPAVDKSQPPGAVVVSGALATGFDTVAARGERPLLREVYGWSGGGRDPFRPLLTTVTSGPELPDLQLLSVIYQQSNPARSVAVFKDSGNNRRYTVSPGDRIGGRIVVVSISTGGATLRMNDFGTTREQTFEVRQPMDMTP
jgi:hypothetical protein